MKSFDWRSRLAAVGAAAVAALLLSTPAEAAVKKVWAGSFHAARSGPCISQEYLGVEPSDSAASCEFFSQVQLPAGSKVQKIQYFYSSHAVVHTLVGLETRFFPETTGMAEWTSAHDSANTGGAVKTIESSTFEFGNRELKNGEMVIIWVRIDVPGPNLDEYNSVVRFKGVKIYYQ